MSERDKVNLIKNLSGDLMSVTNKDVVGKVVGYFHMADSDYGKSLAKALKLSHEKGEKMFMRQ